MRMAPRRGQKPTTPWAKFRILTMVTVLKQDFHVRYNPERIAALDFRDSKDLFLHGLVPPPLNSQPTPLGADQSWTSTGSLVVSSGLRSNSTRTVTFSPARFLGTRHEYEQVPPHPNSRLPSFSLRPRESVIVKVGFDGSRRNFSPLRKVE